jgi:hypothetical protein
MTTTASTPLGQREQEARNIARAEGYPIIEANADWTFFTLDDPLVVPAGQRYGGEPLEQPRTIRTHFEWIEESGRFEAFVS